jgi:hypothetical protein
VIRYYFFTTALESFTCSLLALPTNRQAQKRLENKRLREEMLTYADVC